MKSWATISSPGGAGRIWVRDRFAEIHDGPLILASWLTDTIDSDPLDDLRAARSRPLQLDGADSRRYFAIPEEQRKFLEGFGPENEIKPYWVGGLPAIRGSCNAIEAMQYAIYNHKRQPRGSVEARRARFFRG